MKGMIMKIHMSVTLCLAACLAGSLSWARTVQDLSGAGWMADGAPVTIPHSWNVEDGTDGKGFPPHERLALNSSCASGYERKTVVYARALPAKRPGKRYFVRFEGASIFTTVSVNGKPVGTHNGAFTAFAFEITDALTDGESRLEVAVDNHVQTNAPPVNADFTMYGGLYRGVELIETDPVCIDPVTDGASGVVVHADASSGRVKVDVSLLGSDEAAFSCRVTGPGFDQVFEGLEFTVPNPHLWSPETPSLYTLEVTVRADGSTDTVAERFGFRTVEFKSDGFYLNGRRRFVRGVNHNQDRFGQGWALSAKDHREDLEAIRALGADGIRTTVYPHAQLVYDLCDELGLLAWIETPNVNGLRFTEAFRSNVWAQAREMVAQYRNHPSIIVWGIFNELYNKVPMKEGDPESMMEELRDYIHGLDPSRRVAAVSCEPQKRRLNAVPDVLGFNRYPGWYVGEATDMRGMVDEIVRETGRTTFAMTEYGAGAGTATHGPLRGRVVPRSDFHPMEYQAYIHCEDYRCLRADPRVWGAFVWCMFDFGSDCRLEGEHHGVNDKGLVGFDHRTKKDAYWFYRANWTDDPVLHLVGATADTAPSPTPDILVFCNTGRVTLSINGREVGALDPDEVKSCRWDGVVLDEGDNAVTIRSGDRERTVMWWNPKTERPRFVPECEKNYPESNAFGTVMPAYGFYLRHADGVRFENVRLRTDGPEPRPAIVQDDTTDVAFEGCDFQPGGNDPSAVARRIIDQFLSTEPERYLPEGFRGPAYLMEHPYGEDYHVHYAVVSLWANAIACARKMGDEALVKRLVSRFEPFYGEKKRLCTDLLHVDYTVFGALPLAIYLATGDMRARELGLRYADIQWAEPRKDDRLPHYDDRSYEERMNWWRMGFSGQTRLWIDDSYMIAFLQTQAWRADGDRRRLDRAAAEMAMYLEKLQLEDGLFHHAPEAPYRWARGNGWMAAGMALLLPLLPEDNPHRREILADYRRMMATLRKYQRPDGLWGQLVDEPDSWGETSGSAMFAFAFQNGIKNGLLPANEYRDCVRKAYAAIVARMDEHGNVSDVCEGTGKKNDHAYYLSRSRVNGDPHGQASLLWLCAALWEAGQEE